MNCRDCLEQYLFLFISYSFYFIHVLVIACMAWCCNFFRISVGVCYCYVICVYCILVLLPRDWGTKLDVGLCLCTMYQFTVCLYCMCSL